MIATLEQLSRVDHAWDVYAVATSQEEVGLYGAATSAYALKPTLAIALDVSFAKQHGAGHIDFKLGGGPMLALGPNIHPKVFAKLKEAAPAWR